MSYISDFAAIVGGVSSVYSSYKSNETINEQVDRSNTQAGNVALNQAQIVELSNKIAAATASTTDPEAWGRTAGLFRAILAGEQPQNLDFFRSQFEEIDYAAQAKLRSTDAEAEAARRKIASTVPTGGLKLRMLADIAMKAQDQKATITNEARDAIRNKNLELKNEYMTKALTFGGAQNAAITSGYEKASGVLQGYPTTGAASPDTVLKVSGAQAGAAGTNLNTIGESLAKLGSKEPVSTTGQVTKVPYDEYTPASDKYIEDTGKYYYKGGV
jgi:hypothetical protein